MTNNRHSLQQLAPYAVVASFLVVALAGRLASIADRMARAGEPIAMGVPFVDEISSAAIWLSLLPVVAFIFRRATPSRTSWGLLLPAHAGAIPIISLSHFVLTRLLRVAFYSVQGHTYDFQFAWSDYVSDLYGDVLTYLLFGFIYRGAERLLAPRPVPIKAETAASPPVIEVRDGAQTLYMPAAEILWIEAAGNYVELHATRGRTLLMRATLASLAERLEGIGFIRIHRSRLVNIAAVVAVENIAAGDAALQLMNGAKISASRKYRSALSQMLAARVTGQVAPPERGA